MNTTQNEKVRCLITVQALPVILRLSMLHVQICPLSSTMQFAGGQLTTTTRK